jgi:hypothetical protein
MRTKHILIIFLSSFIFILSLINSGFFSSKLSWDEVDYANASREGILINAFDLKDLNMIQFIKIGMAKSSNNREEIIKISSEVFPEDEQPFLMRHFHPPLPVYYWSLFTTSTNSIVDLPLRLSSVFFFILFIVLFLTLGLKQKEIQPNKSPLQDLLVFCLFTSPVFFLSNSSLNFHIFHALACLFFAFNLQNYLKKYSNKNEWFLAFSLAGLLLTLETGIFVVFVGFLTAIFYKGIKYLLSSDLLRLFVKSFMIFIVFWPGAIISGGPIKSWFMYVYRIFFNSNAEYKGLDIFSNLMQFINSNLLLTLIVIINIVVLILKNSLKEIFNVPVVLGLAYGAFLMPFALNYTYFIPAVTLIVFGIYIQHEKTTI